MARLVGLLVTSIVLIGGAALFYVLSVAGLLFGGPSGPFDLGVYAVTITLLMLGLGTLLLRRVRLRSGQALD